MTTKAKKEESTKEFMSNPLVFVDDAEQFNKDLLEGRAKHYAMSQAMDIPISFFDRGMPDVLAYMDFFNQPYGKEFVEPCERLRYTEIFIAPPWKEIYTPDGERFESYDEAEALHEELMKTYTKFGYHPIEVPKDPITERINFVLDILNSES